MNEQSCDEVKASLNLYRQGQLSEEGKADVEHHLLYCSNCMFLLTLIPSFGPENQ